MKNGNVEADGIKLIDLDQGITKIKNGIKVNKNANIPLERKPSWLRVRLPSSSQGVASTAEVLQRHATAKTSRLVTVCEEAGCPNLSECWDRGTATMMLLGTVCTRACKFCMVDTGNPQGIVDTDEPLKVAQAVQEMQLKYVVLTSVNRDDLEDGGSGHFAQTINHIKDLSPATNLEVLIPDFKGRTADVDKILNARPLVVAQNLETVKSLTAKVRDNRASYEQTLAVLKHIADDGRCISKSSIMLGLGETAPEIEQALQDLREAGVQIVTLGQYLRPTRNHLPIDRWVTPEEFDTWRDRALEIGFTEAIASPLVRSSYKAELAVGIDLHK